MSGALDPPVTSNGWSWTTVGSSFERSGTTFVVSVSTTWQVSISVNGSPERTAEVELRHQQVIGATLHPPTPDGGAGCCAQAAPADINATTTTIDTRFTSRLIVL